MAHHRFIFFIFPFFILQLSLGKSLDSPFDPNPKFPYLTFKSYWDMKKKNTPKIKIFETNDFKGKPKIQLDTEGLKIDNDLVCVWEKDYSKDLYRRFLKIKGGTDDCGKNGAPIFSNESAGGTPLLWIELKSIGKDNYYEVVHEGKTLYIDKLNNRDISFHQSAEAILEKARIKAKPEFEKLLKNDPSLSEFLKRNHYCFKKKDTSCIGKSEERVEHVREHFKNSMCSGGLIDFNADILRSCGPLSPQCNEKEKKDMPHCQGAREARVEFENFFWNVYSDCFFSENGHDLDAEVKIGASGRTAVTLFANKFLRVNCTAVKDKSRGDGNWELYFGE